MAVTHDGPPVRPGASSTTNTQPVVATPVYKRLLADEQLALIGWLPEEAAGRLLNSTDASRQPTKSPPCRSQRSRIHRSTRNSMRLEANGS